MTKLKLCRITRRITQVQLERKTKVKRWKIQLAENGHLKLEDADRRKIAKALEIEADELFNEIN